MNITCVYYTLYTAHDGLALIGVIFVSHAALPISVLPTDCSPGPFFVNVHVFSNIHPVSNSADIR